MSLTEQQGSCWSRAASCDSEHPKVQFFVPWLLLAHCTRCHSSPSTGTRRALLQRAATARACTQTNRRGNWSRRIIQMNSGQAAPGYQTIQTRMPGWFLWWLSNNSAPSALLLGITDCDIFTDTNVTKAPRQQNTVLSLLIIPDLYYCNYFWCNYFSVLAISSMTEQQASKFSPFLPSRQVSPPKSLRFFLPHLRLLSTKS